MPAYVSFCTPKAAGSASGIHQVRKTVSLAVGATSTDQVSDNEFIVIGNTETGMILAAVDIGAPDAAAIGIPIPSGGVSYPIFAKRGAVINIKAAS
jgi:hypothetical protein